MGIIFNIPTKCFDSELKEYISSLENVSRNETKIRYPALFQILDEVDTNHLTHFPQPTWQRKYAIPVLPNIAKIATQHIFAQNTFNTSTI